MRNETQTREDKTMINSFREENTEGYTQIERMALNEEWTDICEELGLEEYTELYDEREGEFGDTVARRTPQTARSRSDRESVWKSGE